MAPTKTETLAALVGYDNASRNSNLALAGWVPADPNQPSVPRRTNATRQKVGRHAAAGPLAEARTVRTGRIPAIGDSSSGIEQAHQPGERLPASGLTACDGLTRRLAARRAA